MKMPQVIDCSVLKCAYNKESSCHAMAITIGDGTTPCCDTFFSASMKGGVDDVAGVGACKVSGCAYNRSLECSAPGIRISRLTCDAECLTYESA